MQTPIIQFGDHEQQIKNLIFNLIMGMPPYNIGPKIQGDYDGVKSYFDKEFEPWYQKKQRRFLKWAGGFLRNGSIPGVLVYQHVDRVVDHKCIQPESFIYPLAELGLEVVDHIYLDRRSTHNHCPGRTWKGIVEHLYVFCQRGADRRKLYVCDEPDGFEDSMGPAQHPIWRISRSGMRPEHTEHDAVMPRELAYRIIHRYCPPGGSVCDPYLGTGTSAIAAMELGRDFVGAEIQRRHYNYATKRVQQFLSDNHQRCNEKRTMGSRAGLKRRDAAQNSGCKKNVGFTWQATGVA